MELHIRILRIRAGRSNALTILRPTKENEAFTWEYVKQQEYAIVNATRVAMPRELFANPHKSDKTGNIL